MARGWELDKVSDTRNGRLCILSMLHMQQLITVLRLDKDTGSRARCYTRHIVRSNRRNRSIEHGMLRNLSNLDDHVPEKRWAEGWRSKERSGRAAASDYKGTTILASGLQMTVASIELAGLGSIQAFLLILCISSLVNMIARVELCKRMADRDLAAC
jgi:hypothetical protein